MTIFETLTELEKKKLEKGTDLITIPMLNSLEIGAKVKLNDSTTLRRYYEDNPLFDEDEEEIEATTVVVDFGDEEVFLVQWDSIEGDIVFDCL